MADILQDFIIKESISRVFEIIVSPVAMDQWWTKRCSGEQKVGGIYQLWFGPAYDWRGTITKLAPSSDFELEISQADDDWNGTRVGFHCERRGGSTAVRFYHTGWPEANEHYRISCYCWAMYLRILKRHIEFGETVPYERRLEV